MCSRRWIRVFSGAEFVKSTHCEAGNSACLEFAAPIFPGGFVFVRNSRDAETVLAVERLSWGDFIESVKAGDFGDLRF
ncbi:DUF397 domain-containing protein [Streptomyces phaeochromogenes]